MAQLVTVLDVDGRTVVLICAMTIRVANTDFDRVDYDAEADVLYLASKRSV